jgi:hypothetical protein
MLGKLGLHQQVDDLDLAGQKSARASLGHHKGWAPAQARAVCLNLDAVMAKIRKKVGGCHCHPPHSC